MKLLTTQGHLSAGTVHANPEASARMPRSTVVAVEVPEVGVRALYREHSPALHRALRRLAAPGVDADDLLQEVFLVALRRSEALLAAQSPRAWLYGVAVKVASDSRRRWKVRRFFALESAVELAAEGGPLVAAERRQTVEQVHLALEKLSEKKREALILFELEGLSGQEIALALDCPLKTVWTRLHHARQGLHVELAASRERGVS